MYEHTNKCPGIGLNLFQPTDGLHPSLLYYALTGLVNNNSKYKMQKLNSYSTLNTQHNYKAYRFILITALPLAFTELI